MSLQRFIHHKSGSVLIYKNEGNTRIELDTVGPGAVIGEIAPTEDGGIRSTSGVAIEKRKPYINSSGFPGYSRQSS